MNSKNDYFRDFLNVTEWHKQGYTGRYGISGSVEDFENASPTEHAYKTAYIFHEIAPDRKLIHVPTNEENFIDTIKNNNIDSVFGSVSARGLGGGYRDFITDKLSSNCFVGYAVGNDGDERANAYLTIPVFYGVGAVFLNYSEYYQGKPTSGATLNIKVADYSSITDRIDFSAPTNLYVDNRYFTGTSCATPVLVGMVALINDFFIQKTGKPLSYEKMYQFLQDNSMDIETEGKDNKSGWGVVRLPNPQDIDINKYQTIREDDDMVNSVNEYKDVANISSWAKDAVDFCTKQGIFQGDENGYFLPKDNITREEVAVLIERILNK